MNRYLQGARVLGGLATVDERDVIMAERGGSTVGMLAGVALGWMLWRNHRFLGAIGGFIVGRPAGRAVGNLVARISSVKVV